MENTHAVVPTGETFVMCTPKDWLVELVFPSKRREQRYYDTLRDTIIACGGKVLTTRVAPVQSFEDRLGMYPRDVGIVLPRGEEPILFTPGTHGAASSMETHRLARLAEKHDLAREETIPGRVDGGNMIYDPSRHVLFVGVSNYHHVTLHAPDNWRTQTDAQGVKRRVACDPIENVPPELRQDYVRARIRYAEPTREWLSAAREKMPAATVDGVEKPLQIVPLFMPDKDIKTFYHLDGVFNMLPSGQAVACPSVMSKAALHRVERIVGKDKIFAVSEQDAARGATNFITVGTHVITPYASDTLKKQLAGLGYNVVDPPAVGLPSGAWRFSDGAFVRCATLKMTPDMGYPQAEKNRGAEAAVSIPSR